jgi:hypothetical protein
MVYAGGNGEDSRCAAAPDKILVQAVVGRIRFSLRDPMGFAVVHTAWNCVYTDRDRLEDHGFLHTVLLHFRILRSHGVKDPPAAEAGDLRADEDEDQNA